MHRLGLVLGAIPIIYVVITALFLNRQIDSGYFLVGVCLLAAAVLLYAACWAVGWVIVGFMKDE